MTGRLGIWLGVRPLERRENAYVAHTQPLEMIQLGYQARSIARRRRHAHVYGLPEVDPDKKMPTPVENESAILDSDNTIGRATRRHNRYQNERTSTGHLQYASQVRYRFRCVHLIQWRCHVR